MNNISKTIITAITLMLILTAGTTQLFAAPAESSTSELATKAKQKVDSTATELKSKKPIKHEANSTMVILKTSAGDITVSLDAEKAPKTVANFLAYVKSGHYSSTIFHRVIKDFMIQGGGFEPGMSQKSTQPPVENEADNGLVNDKYTIAMARTGDPHSATAQFFINTKNNDFLNFTSKSTSGWGYTVFGEVVEGKDIVDQINTVSTGQSGPYGDVPLEDVVINSIEISE